MSEINKEENVPGNSRQSIRMDILMFKDDILKDMRGIQKQLDGKYMKTDENLTYKINNFETKINLFEKKIFELSNKINTDNKIRENIETLNQFKEETSDTLFKRRVKYNEFEKRMNDEINRINNILADSVIYPGIIGGSAKYKSFHDFMDHIMEEIGQLSVFREKSGLDMGPYKKKIEQSIEGFKIQLNNYNNIQREYTLKSIQQAEERLNNLIKIYDDRLQDTRVENSHYSIGLEKKSEELKNEIAKLKKFQENSLKKYAKFNKEDIFNNFSNELIIMNNKINKLSSMLKDLLSFIKMPDKKAKVYSGVKQYIHGYLNANELSSMKNFSLEKSKTKNYDDISFAIRKTPTEFKRQSFIKRDIYFSNSINNNSPKETKEPLKKFVSQKSLKLKDSADSYNEPIPKNKMYVVTDIYQAMNSNDNNNENKGENKEVAKKNLSRRLTYNSDMISSRNRYKFNEDGNNNNKNKVNFNDGNIIYNKLQAVKIKDKNEKSKSGNFSDNSSSKKGSDESKNNIILSKKNSKNAEFAIKEEDENNISESSSIKISNRNIKEKGKNKDSSKSGDNINSKDNSKNTKDSKNNKDNNKDDNNNQDENNNNSNNNSKDDNNNKDNVKKDANNKNYKDINKENAKDNNDSSKDNIKNMKLDINKAISPKKENIYRITNVVKNDNMNNLKKVSKTEENNKNINDKANNRLNNYINSISKGEVKKINNTKNHNNNNNYKVSINSLRKYENKNRNQPILGMLNYGFNEDFSIRSQSSKRRNASNNNIPFNRNIIREKVNSAKKENLYISYNNNYIYNNTFTNFHSKSQNNNRVGQNFPKLNDQKLESIPSYDNKAVKLINFSGINNNISQNYTTKRNDKIIMHKKIKLGTQGFSPNGMMLKKNNRIMKNKSLRIVNERTNEARELEKMFNNLQSYIPHY